MKCQTPKCKKKAKVKCSTVIGWVRCWCYKHAMLNMNGLLRQVVRYNGGLYIQKVAKK